ncbi:MAG: redoxin domain-containing protein [Prevotella sp.]|jgi:thiol-disulfide isomerase/thioredoxin
MKKIIIALALAVSAIVPATASTTDGNVHFKGKLNGLKDSLIVISPTADNKVAHDTVLVKDGEFEFSVTVNKPTEIAAVTPATLRRQENIGFRAIAVPGETAELSGDLGSAYYFSGSKFYREYNEADRAMEAASKPFADFMEKMNERKAAGESQEVLMKEYQEKIPAFEQQLTDGILNFIKQHPTSEASAAIIPQIRGLEAMEEAVNLLSPEVREGRMKIIYKGYMDNMKARAQAEAEAAKKQAVGVEAPDFTLNDINGKPLKLSSLRGKYVVLDFWGSWCIWCIKGFPEMKNYYEKYKGKFEILGIDCNDTEDKWKAAVKKHGLPWLHVYNPRNSKVLADYAIQGFPTKIIVGPDGKIVKTVVGEDPSFYTFLDELFGK